MSNHTPPDLSVSAPLLSHRPTPVGSLVKGGVKGRGDGDDDDKGGEAADSSQYIYIYTVYIVLKSVGSVRLVMFF